MKRTKFSERRALFFVLVAIPGILIFSAIVMLLWNAILPGVVNVTKITFWQALGILVLSKILFGGFRGGWSGRRQQWRMQVPEKWESMTTEEKERFKQEWQSRCGRWWKDQSGVGSREPGVKSQESGVGSQESNDPVAQVESLK